MAVNVILVPAHIGFVPLVIAVDTEGITVGLTVTSDVDEVTIPQVPVMTQ